METYLETFYVACHASHIVYAWHSHGLMRAGSSSTPVKNRSDSQGETSCVEEAAILDRIKWNSKPPFPPNQGCSRAKAKTPHFPILDLGGGEGYKFPIYFVQDCSLCNALIAHKTRIALMAFSKKKICRSLAMDEKKYCNINRIQAISKLSASLTNRVW